jgi:hypothetical protein
MKPTTEPTIGSRVDGAVATAKDSLGNAYDSVKGWAGEDTGFGVNKGTAAGLGVGAAGILAYMLNRSKDNDD